MKIRENENMVLIKNLPSNIVSEAWVVLKPGVKKREKEFIKKVRNNKKCINPEKGYIVKEAEMVITEYLKDITDIKKNRNYEKMIKKYEKLKKVSLSIVIILISIIFMQNLFF